MTKYKTEKRTSIIDRPFEDSLLQLDLVLNDQNDGRKRLDVRMRGSGKEEQRRSGILQRRQRPHAQFGFGACVVVTEHRLARHLSAEWQVCERSKRYFGVCYE